MKAKYNMKNNFNDDVDFPVKLEVSNHLETLRMELTIGNARKSFLFQSKKKKTNYLLDSVVFIIDYKYVFVARTKMPLN